MRKMRKLMVVAVVATAAMAWSASSAVAQVTVSQEGGAGAVCPAVTVTNHVVSGGCHVDAATVAGNPAILVQHINPTTEVTFSICDNTFEARVNGTGGGYIYNQTLTGANCGRTPCDEAENQTTPHADLPWAAQFNEPSAGVETLTVTFCLRAAGTPEGNPGSPTPQGIPCTVTIPVATENGHDLRLTANDVPCAGLPVELTGQWLAGNTSGEEIEIAH